MDMFTKKVVRNTEKARKRIIGPLKKRNINMKRILKQKDNALKKVNKKKMRFNTYFKYNIKIIKKLLFIMKKDFIFKEKPTGNIFKRIIKKRKKPFNFEIFTKVRKYGTARRPVDRKQYQRNQLRSIVTKVKYLVNRMIKEKRIPKYFEKITKKSNRREFRRIHKQKKKFNRELYLRKKYTIYVDLLLIDPPKKKKKIFSMTSYRHFIKSAKFYPHIFQFIYAYPFSAQAIGNIFSIPLNIENFISTRKEDFLNFLLFGANFVQEEQIVKKNYISITQKIKELVKKIIKKNIINKKFKFIMAEQKKQRIMGINYNPFYKRKKRLISRKRIKKKKLNTQLSYFRSLKINKILKNNNSDKKLIKLFFILDKLVNKKKIKKDIFVVKNKISAFDFFYKKHITELMSFLNITK